MADDKDRFGNKLHDKERGEEGRYFSERDRALIEKLKQQKAGAVEQAASMRCPKDGTALASVDHRRISRGAGASTSRRSSNSAR